MGVATFLRHGRTFLFAPSSRFLTVAAAVVTVVALVVATPSDSRAASPFARGPYLQELGPNSVSVRFELATGAPAAVSVALDDVPDSVPAVVATDPFTVAYHAIRVGGLAPARRYRYVVRALGASESGTFTTAPDDASTAPFSFVVFGDNRSDEVAHAAVVRALLTARGDFLLHTGDFVSDGASPENWQTFFSIEKPLLRDRALFGCVGNHELVDKEGSAYLRYFAPTELAALLGRTPASASSTAPLQVSPVAPPTPRIGAKSTPPSPFTLGGAAAPTPRTRLYWSFRWASARFFMLNGTDTWLNDEELEWLRGELARAKTEAGVVWRIAVLHHGPYSAGPHGNNAKLHAAGVPDLLARAGVDLVLSGHDHIYERGFGSGLRYVVSGGGGAPLYRIAKPLDSTRKAEAAYHAVEVSVTTDAVKLAARRVDGSLIETCGFTKAPGWDCDGPNGVPDPGAAPLALASSDAAVPVAVPSPSPVRSKCACSTPGARTRRGEGAFAAAAVAAVAATLVRRRRAVRS